MALCWFDSFISNRSMDIMDEWSYLQKLASLGSLCKTHVTGVQLHLYSGVICN